MQRTYAMRAERALPGLRGVGAVVLFAALVAAGSHVRIPIPGNPVPLTLQVIFVLLAGACLRPAVAASSMVLFVTVGLLGAPVFSGGGAGPAYLLGPTGGYLAGFVAGAAVCSLVLGGRRDRFGRVALAMASGITAIHVLGALHLAIYLGGDVGSALRLGVVPFLPADLFKILAAAAFVSGLSSMRAGQEGTPTR